MFFLISFKMSKFFQVFFSNHRYPIYTNPHHLRLLSKKIQFQQIIELIPLRFSIICSQSNATAILFFSVTIYTLHRNVVKYPAI